LLSDRKTLPTPLNEFPRTVKATMRVISDGWPALGNVSGEL
jgi:hypothetical protein